jgi:prepilin-type N-terminal cleavage/methylation domain-containing protein
MIESLSPVDRRGQRGFTLLEIMISLAVLAVGAMCVLSTFAAAIALHMRRENAARQRMVVEEAVVEAQSMFDAYVPGGKGKELPPAIPGRAYSRDDQVEWSVTFLQADGVDPRVAVRAKITIREEDSRGQMREREEWAFLDRAGFPLSELKKSIGFEQEKKDQEQKAGSGSSRPR